MFPPRLHAKEVRKERPECFGAVPSFGVRGVEEVVDCAGSVEAQETYDLRVGEEGDGVDEGFGCVLRANLVDPESGVFDVVKGPLEAVPYSVRYVLERGRSGGRLTSTCILIRLTGCGAGLRRAAESMAASEVSPSICPGRQLDHRLPKHLHSSYRTLDCSRCNCEELHVCGHHQPHYAMAPETRSRACHVTLPANIIHPPRDCNSGTINFCSISNATLCSFRDQSGISLVRSAVPSSGILSLKIGDRSHLLSIPSSTPLTNILPIRS